MSVNIEMPKLSDTMTEGTLIKWHKKVGDIVEIGDILAEVETDKATMEMEAFDDGVITEILIKEGEKALIGGTIAILDGNSDQPTATPTANQATAESPPLSSTTQNEETTTANLIHETQPGRVRASPLARKVASETGIKLSEIVGTGPANRIVKSDVLSAIKQPEKAPLISTEAFAAASLLASVKAKSITSTPSITPASVPSSATIAILPTSKEGDERIELSSMRKIIASRLLTSKTTIPHFYLHLEVDVAPLMAIRTQINVQAEKTHGNKYSLNDFIIKAVINAVQTIPAVNSSFAGDHIVKFKHVGLSVAIAVDDGLVTPVIKQAESKSLLAISRAVKVFTL